MATSANRIKQITLDTQLDRSCYHSDTRLCQIFDKLLCEVKFRGLHTVMLHKTIPSMLFPTLSSPNLLSIPRKPTLSILMRSFWEDQPAERYVEHILIEYRSNCQWSIHRLPLEICLHIVDLIYNQWIKSGWSFEAQKTLFACSLVCRAWRSRVERLVSFPII